MQNIVLLPSVFIVFFKIKVGLYDLQLCRIRWHLKFCWLINKGMPISNIFISDSVGSNF